MTAYVLSTMTGDVAYAFYSGNAKDGVIPFERKRIMIRGGAGLPSLTSGFGDRGEDDTGHPMWTPEGVVTPVKDTAFAELKDHPLFMQHMDGGYIKVINKDIIDNYSAVKKEVRSMEPRDNSAQLTPTTVKSKIDAKMPKVSTGESDDDVNFAGMPKIK